MIKILVAEEEEKRRAATVSRLRGIMGDEALIETAADGTDAVQMAITAHKKVSDIENLMKEEKYAGEEDQALLQQWLDAAEKEVSYADDNMKNLYSEGISSFQSYLSDVVLAKTDVGSKGSRLALTKSRMSEQQMTFKKLKSTNEDKELSDIIIDYTAAYNAYQASMQAASKAIKQTLLDYI